MKVNWLLPIIFILLFSLAAKPVLAQSSVSSDNYEITWPNVNMGAGLPTSSSYKMGVTTGQNAPGLYTSTGYKIRAGFQYIHSIIPFRFSISDISIAFGTLTVGTPKTENNILTVSFGAAGGYQVTAQENKPLTSGAGKKILDTECDATDCDETSAGVWSQNTTYGFGFNMTNISGNDVPTDFVDSTYYRQFADISAPEPAQVVMSSPNVGKDRKAMVTYKINVSTTQEAGTYGNIITFIATPSY